MRSAIVAAPFEVIRTLSTGSIASQRRRATVVFDRKLDTSRAKTLSATAGW
jgi:hypothetical protein